MRRQTFFVIPFLFFLGCAEYSAYQSVPVEGISPTPSQNYITEDLQTYDSLHFRVRSRNYQKRFETAGWLEEVYQRIMFDTNLLSFKPKENYTVTIYRDREEYSLKTGYPSWSGGGAVTKMAGQVLPSEKEGKARTSIVTFNEVAKPSLLAHEVTHLIFNEFMEFKNIQEAERVFWLNEGLATYEEYRAREETERDDFLKITAPLLIRNAMPFSQMIYFRPLNEKAKMIGFYSYQGEKYIYTNIDLWYWQVRAVTDFLISGHGSYSFFLFLNAHKQGKEILEALREAYPGKWKNLEALESEWKASLKSF